MMMMLLINGLDILMLLKKTTLQSKDEMGIVVEQPVFMMYDQFCPQNPAQLQRPTLIL